MISTQEINDTVNDFKGSVQALKKIDNLCDKTESQFNDLLETMVSLEGLTKDLYDTSIKLSDTANAIEKSVVDGTEKLSEAYNAAAKLVRGECTSMRSVLQAESKRTLGTLDTFKKDISDQNKKCISLINDTAEAVQESTRKYTLSTQAAVEDLRIDQTRMTSELRRNAEETKQILKDEIDDVNKKVEKLSEMLSMVVNAQQRTQKILVAATVFAALSSVLAVLGMII